MVEISSEWLYNNPQTLTYTAGTYIHIYDVDAGDFIYSAYPSSFTIGANETKTITITKEHWESGDSDERTAYVYGSQPTYTHTIVYNNNGGSGSMSNSVITDTNSGNTNVTFASNTFIPPTNYKFIGWKINNTDTLYQPGSTYPVSGNNSVTAYAQWELEVAQVDIKVNDLWIKGNVYVKVNDEWKPVKKVSVKVSDTWEEVE